jgi:hypothetical protein
VQLVLSGHDHDCQRSKEINGVTYMVTGAAAIGCSDPSRARQATGPGTAAAIGA